MVSKVKINKSLKITQVFPREVYMFRVSRKETEGTEAMKTRPGIVISVEGLNKWNKRCIMVPATTKKTDLAKIYPFEVKVIIGGKKAMIDQLKTYSLGRIIKNSFLGKVTEKEMEEIQEKIMSACSLWEYLKKREVKSLTFGKRLPQQELGKEYFSQRPLSGR